MSAIVPEVPMAVVGCDFRVASSAWRSRLVLSAAEADDLAEVIRSVRMPVVQGEHRAARIAEQSGGK